MKKLLLVVLVICTILSSVVTAFANINDKYIGTPSEFMYNNSREFKGSQIDLSEYNGQCVHFGEEAFYQRYGIWFNLKNNKNQSLKSLKNRKFKNDNGETFIIRFSTTPKDDSLMWIDACDYRRLGYNATMGHIAYVYYVDDTTIYTMESDIRNPGSDVNYYYGCWYWYCRYQKTDYPYVYYIYPEKI